ncbi:MAG: DUF3619 family protein [Candidatus Accumulibacter sp.]|jgi:hypothetical protein|nr:DUF3619 family protein [Accumulibacter sp.]
MNERHEQQFALKIAQRLNDGARDLSTETAGRLTAARNLALAHQKQPVAQTAFATLGAYIFPEPMRFRQMLVSSVLFLSLTAFSAFWMADREINEMSVIDSELLADELPIGAFADQGFSTWLKRTSSE